MARHKYLFRSRQEAEDAYRAAECERTLLRFAILDGNADTHLRQRYSIGGEAETLHVSLHRCTSPSGGFVIDHSFGNARAEYLDAFADRVSKRAALLGGSENLAYANIARCLLTFRRERLAALIEEKAR